MAATEHARPVPETAVRTTGLATRAAAFVGAMLVIVALAVLPLLTPFFVHPALEASGSAELLSLAPAQARAMSDRSIEALLLPMRSFAFAGPDAGTFYDASERSHLADARILLWLFLVAGAASAILLAAGLARSDPVRQAAIWRSVALAGATAAIVVVILAVISMVAFGALFTLFHQVFFPAGNWAFDPSTQRVVQLYPFRFWQVAAAAFGTLVLALGASTWLLGRSAGRRVRRAQGLP